MIYNPINHNLVSKVVIVLIKRIIKWPNNLVKKVSVLEIKIFNVIGIEI